jgi:hypothetical protein
MDLAIAGGFVVQPIESTDMAGLTTTDTYVALQLGGWFRYQVVPKLTVFTGVPATPQSDVSINRFAGFAQPPIPYQLSIGLNQNNAMTLQLAGGAGYQIKPNIYAFAALSLANIKLHDSANAFIFKDFIPVAIGGYYSLNKIDIGATFTDDFKQGFDYLTFLINARYYVN